MHSVNSALPKPPSRYGVVTAPRSLHPPAETDRLLHEAAKFPFDAGRLINARRSDFRFKVSDRLTNSLAASAWRETAIAGALLPLKLRHARAVRKQALTEMEDRRHSQRRLAAAPPNPDGNLRGRTASTRILMVAPNYPSPANPGAYAFVHARVSAYLRAGAEVFVVTEGLEPRTVAHSYDGITYYQADEATLRTWIKTLDVHYVFVHSPRPKLLHYLTEECADRPVTLFLHGYESRDRLRLSLNYPLVSLPSAGVVAELVQIERLSALRRFIETTPHRVICPSVHHRDIVFTDLQLKHEKTRIKIVPNPVSEHFFQAAEDPSRRCGRILVIASGSKPNYGAWLIPRLMRTLKRLDARAAKRASIMIYSADSAFLRLHPSLTPFIAPPQPSARIAQLLGQAQCVINPSLYETQGMVSCESVAAGAALIACDAGGNREHLEPAGATFTEPRGPSLAACALEALETPPNTDRAHLDHMRPDRIVAADLELDSRP